ncbi:MAG TPA: hypothetical protein VFQ53_37670 [Kofleriaceae bacterium]|nr:hypothetical protein [Kofleriaceae bacterium]
MKLKALLLCDDIRFEIGGTVTLVGVYNERLIVPPGDGAIEVPRFAFLAVIGGLRGVEEIGFRQWIRSGEGDPADRPLALEPHDPENDEHSFAFTQAPMVFPGVGAYEVGIDVEVRGRRQGYRYAFSIERRPS